MRLYKALCILIITAAAKARDVNAAEHKREALEDVLKEGALAAESPPTEVVKTANLSATKDKQVEQVKKVLDIAEKASNAAAAYNEYIESTKNTSDSGAKKVVNGRPTGSPTPIPSVLPTSLPSLDPTFSPSKIQTTAPVGGGTPNPTSWKESVDWGDTGDFGIPDRQGEIEVSYDKITSKYLADATVSGMMFDVKARKNMWITTLHLHMLQVESKVLVYYRFKGYEGESKTPEEWTQAYDGTMTGKGKGFASGMGTFAPPIEMKGNQIFGLYVHLEENGAMYAVQGWGTGNQYSNNSHIFVYTGIGKFFLFGREVENRNFSGQITYVFQQATAAPVPAPVPSPPVIPPPPPPPCPFIGTGFNGNRGLQGCMFDIVTKNDRIHITSMEIHSTLKVQQDVEVYTKQGSWEGFQRDYKAWKLLTSGKVTGKGQGYGTPLSNFSGTGVTVEPSSRQGWYITYVTDCKTCNWMMTTFTTNPVGSVFRFNDSIQVLVGKTSRYFFGMQGDFNAGFNGVIKYNKDDTGTCTPYAATAFPSAAPTHFKPTIPPSRKPSSSPTIKCTTITTPTVCPYTDREWCALWDLFKATAGCAWTSRKNWFLTGRDKCTWYGVNCSKDGSVTSLNLYDNKLKGTIPTSIGGLLGLTSLELGKNSLSRTIPTQIGFLQNLSILLLDDNNLIGSVSSAGDICKLSYKGKLVDFRTDCTIGDKLEVKCGCCNDCIAPSAKPSKAPIPRAGR